MRVPHLKFQLACKVFMLCSTIASTATAQEASEPNDSSDPLDLSRYESMIDDAGFPTVEGVNRLEGEANAAFASGDCDAAIPLLVEYYTSANTLGNAIRQGLEPFYSASYQEREDNSVARELDQLVSAEKQFNLLVIKRNAAWVMEAECLISTGKREEGIVRLFRALEYISITPEDRDLWQRARTLLWDQVGYVP